MSPHNPFDDPKLVTELAQAFESIWLVMRAHDPLLDADRAKDLSIEISRKLVELAAAGVTDPAQLRRLALEKSAALPGTLAGFLYQGIIGPFRRMHDSADNEPHSLTIDRPYLSSSDQSIKLLSFHSGDSFVFLDLPLARIVDQSAAYQSVIRLSAIAALCAQRSQAWGAAMDPHPRYAPAPPPLLFN